MMCGRLRCCCCCIWVVVGCIRVVDVGTVCVVVVCCCTCAVVSDVGVAIVVYIV